MRASKRLSLGMAFFQKVLGTASSSRCVFQAEYDTATGSFILTQLLFLQRRSRISSVANHREFCKNVADVLERLAIAAKNAMLEGYTFDVSGMRLLEHHEEDETWLKGLRVNRTRTKRTLKIKH